MVACGAKTLTSPSPSGRQNSATARVRSTYQRALVSTVSSVVFIASPSRVAQLVRSVGLEGVERPTAAVEGDEGEIGGGDAGRVDQDDLLGDPRVGRAWRDDALGHADALPLRPH